METKTIKYQLERKKKTFQYYFACYGFCPGVGQVEDDEVSLIATSFLYIIQMQNLLLSKKITVWFVLN